MPAVLLQRWRPVTALRFDTCVLRLPKHSTHGQKILDRRNAKKQVKLSFKGGLTQRTFRRLMIQKIPSWVRTRKNLKCCNVEQVRTGGAKGPVTSAYQAKHVAPLLVQYVSDTGKLPPSVATPRLGAVCARPLAYTFVKRVCKRRC